MRVFNLLAAILVWAAPVFAIDLTEMQQMALSNREVVQRYIAILEQSEQDIVRARGGYYPVVDIGYTANTLDEDSLLEERQNSVAFGRISYNIFAGFRDP